MEGWNKKNNNVDQKKPTQNDSLEDLETSSQESLLEGSCRQNIFKNELTNLSNGLFSMHLKDTKMNNISKPYFQSIGVKQNLRPVSVLQGRKLQGVGYMSQEKRSVSYVVKDKGTEEGLETIESTKQEEKGEGKKEKGKGRDREKVEKSEKEKDKEREKEGGKKEKKKKKREKEKEVEEEKEVKEVKIEEMKVEKEKKVELETVIEKEKEKEKPQKMTISSEKDSEKNKEKEKEKDKEKDKEKEKEKNPERTLERQQHNTILAKCRFQEKYIKEQEQEKKDKKLDLKKRVSGNTKVIDFAAPVIKQKELPNRKLYLKVMQMLEKAKRPDDKSNTGINSSTDVLAGVNPAEITEFTPNKIGSKQHKAILNSSPPPKYHSNTCLTSTTQQESGELNKGIGNEANVILSPIKELKTPSKFRMTMQGTQILPTIENNINNKSLNSITKSMQVSARACHKIGKVNPDKFSNSMVYQPNMSEDMESSEVMMQQKNQSMVLEDNRDSVLWRMQYHSQRSTDAYGQPNQAISRNDEENFVPYSQQYQKQQYQGIMEPERKEYELQQGRVRGQGRSSSVNQSKVYEGKNKQKEGAGVKIHVFQLPLPSIQMAPARELLTLQVKKDASKGMKRYKRKEIIQGVEDFFKKDEEVETERDIRSYFVKPKVEVSEFHVIR